MWTIIYGIPYMVRVRLLVRSEEIVKKTESWVGGGGGGAFGSPRPTNL